MKKNCDVADTLFEKNFDTLKVVDLNTDSPYHEKNKSFFI